MEAFRSRRKMTRLLYSSIVFSAVVLASCQTAPYTGRSQFIVTSIEEENNMGDEAWREVSSQYKVSGDKKLKDALSRVGKNLAAVAERPDFAWEFKVFDSKDANAFCLPGGKIAVFSGLFDYLSNDAELAAVVGHEIGHAIARHGAERMSQSLVQQVGGQILQTALGAANSSYEQAWMVAYGGISGLGVILPYSRTQEYEADKIGVFLMAKAGYDPAASLSFWKKFSQISSQSSIGEFFSTHPMSTKRMQEMEALMPEARQYYANSQSKKGSGETYKR